MAKKSNSVLFYFWAHDQLNEIKTGVLDDLVERADAALMEVVYPDQELIGVLERDLNDYIKTGSFSNVLTKLTENCSSDDDSSSREREDYGSDAMLFVAELMRGTKKRIILERNTFPSFDYLGEATSSLLIFLKKPLDFALKVRRDFLQRSAEYNAERERNVVDQVLKIRGTTLVTFGAGHGGLAKLVRDRRPVEVHYPYKNYPVKYACQTK